MNGVIDNSATSCGLNGGARWILNLLVTASRLFKRQRRHLNQSLLLPATVFFFFQSHEYVLSERVAVIISSQPEASRNLWWKVDDVMSVEWDENLLTITPASLIIEIRKISLETATSYCAIVSARPFTRYSTMIDEL